MLPSLNNKKSVENIPNIFSVQIRFLQLVAQWPVDVADYLPRPFKFISPILTRIFQILSTVLAGHIFLLHLKTMYELLDGNLADLAELCTVVFVYLFDFFLIVYMQARHDLLRETITLMNQSFRKRSAIGITYTTIEKAHLQAKRFSIFWITICVMGSTLWALYPLTLQGRHLPLKCWYPFDEKQPIVYEVLYIVHIIAQIQLGIAFPNGSSLYVSFITIICGQYDILFCSLKNFTYTAQLETNGVTTHVRQSQIHHNFTEEEVNQYYCSQEEYEDLDAIQTHSSRVTIKKLALQKALKNCVQHHLAIMRACRKMEMFFSPICLVKTLQIMFQLCFMAFFVVNADASPFRIMNFGQYLILTSVELTLYTYFGEILSSHSVRAVDAIQRSQWYEESRRIKNEISIILANSLAPMKITSGKFSAMDIEKWKTVFKSAFSFFTLLQTIK